MKKRRIAIIGLVALLVLGVAGWKGYGWWLKHKLERYKAELAARGEKLTVDDLLAGRTNPDHNGANLFRQAQIRLRHGGILTTNAATSGRLVCIRLRRTDAARPRDGAGDKWRHNPPLPGARVCLRFAWDGRCGWWPCARLDFGKGHQKKAALFAEGNPQEFQRAFMAISALL